MDNIQSFKEHINNGKFVYIVIDQDMHSYEAILGIYDTFEKAMGSDVWSERGEVPDKNGRGDSLFIYEEVVK